MADASREYGEGRDPIPAVHEPTVIFMINNSLPRDSWTDLDVYRAPIAAGSSVPMRGSAPSTPWECLTASSEARTASNVGAR